MNCTGKPGDAYFISLSFARASSRLLLLLGGPAILFKKLLGASLVPPAACWSLQRLVAFAAERWRLGGSEVGGLELVGAGGPEVLRLEAWRLVD